MRPVEKLTPGESFKTPDGSLTEVLDCYDDYHNAKPALIHNLGMYCSYCEEAYHQPRDLHVEHVQPKGYEEGGVKIYVNFQGRSAIIAYPPSSSERSGEGEGGYAIR